MKKAQTAGFSLVRLGEDPERLRVLLGDFLRDTADAPQRLAVQLQAEALPQVAAIVHRIRGAALYMDATALCQVGRRIEQAAQQNDRASIPELVQEFLALLAVLRDFLLTHLQHLPAAHTDTSCLKR